MKNKSLLFGIFFFLPFTIYYPVYPSNIYISFVTILIFSVISLYKKEIIFDEIFILCGFTLILVTFYPLIVDDKELPHLLLYYFTIISLLFLIIPNLRLSEKNKNFSRFLSLLPLFVFFIIKISPVVFPPNIIKYDWCYPSCSEDVQLSFKFSSNGTYTFSTIMFGGMSRWGTWEEIDDNTFRLTTTRISTNSSNDQLPEPQIVTLTSDKKLRVGSTVYVRN